MKKLMSLLLAGVLVLVVGCKIEIGVNDVTKIPYEPSSMDIVRPDGSLLILDFDNSTIKKFYDATTEVKDYHIMINTAGGNAVNTVAMINRIQELQSQGAHITTEVYGYALSAGAVLFMTGDERIIHSGAILMFHCSRFNNFGGTMTQKTERTDVNSPGIDFLTLIDENFAELLREKTSMTEEEIQDWLFFEDANFMSSKEAHELNVATILI